MILKTILAQIYCDDSTDTSERTIGIKIKKAKSDLEFMTINEELALQILGPNAFTFVAKIGEAMNPIEIEAFSLEYSDDIHKALE